MQDIYLVSLFNGASIAQKALIDIGFNLREVYTSEVDKFALLHELEKYPNNIKLGDVSKVDFKSLRLEILKDNPNAIILLFGGSPCQNLSFVGNRKGMTTKCDIEIDSLFKYLELKDEEFEFQGQSYLFWEFERAREDLKPDFYFLENVKMSGSNKKVFDAAIGVSGIMFDSSLVSAQQRKRYYWFNWWTPAIDDREITLSSVLDNSQQFKEIGEWTNSEWGGKKKIDKLRTVGATKAFTLTTSKTHSSQYYLNTDKTLYRNFSINEYEKLQTFPEDWTKAKGIPTGQRYRMVGNSWTLEMVKELFTPLRDILNSLSEVA